MTLVETHPFIGAPRLKTYHHQEKRRPVAAFFTIRVCTALLHTVVLDLQCDGTWLLDQSKQLRVAAAKRCSG